jgi:hypothetical protein
MADVVAGCSEERVKGMQIAIEKIARSRFELLSRDPESHMIDRYTTGLNVPVLV